MKFINKVLCDCIRTSMAYNTNFIIISKIISTISFSMLLYTCKKAFFSASITTIFFSNCLCQLNLHVLATMPSWYFAFYHRSPQRYLVISACLIMYYFFWLVNGSCVFNTSVQLWWLIKERCRKTAWIITLTMLAIWKTGMK